MVEGTWACLLWFPKWAVSKSLIHAGSLIAHNVVADVARQLVAMDFALGLYVRDHLNCSAGVLVFTCHSTIAVILESNQHIGGPLLGSVLRQANNHFSVTTLCSIVSMLFVYYISILPFWPTRGPQGKLIYFYTSILHIHCILKKP